MYNVVDSLYTHRKIIHLDNKYSISQTEMWKKELTPAGCFFFFFTGKGSNLDYSGCFVEELDSM